VTLKHESFLDFFIVNVALPSIQHDLRAGEGAIEWIVAGYAVSTAVLLVTGGRLGDQFGRRRVFAAGAVLGAAGYAALYLAAGHGGPVAWLFPGLVLLGAGQGLCITPLTTTVLSHADPATAGSVSGVLSTAQQVGNWSWPR
jgi:MFS family permease